MINFFIVAYHFILHIHVKNVHHRYICKLFAVFRNVGFYYSDAEEIPRRQFIITTTRRKLKI